MEEGIVFEAMNLAAIKELPTLFLCENNRYSIHTPINDRTLASNLIDRAESFGLPAKLLDGNDAISLYTEFSDIMTFVREKNQPFFVEVETYRYCGHVGPEDDDHYNYRPDTERQEWLDRDPIKALRDLFSILEKMKLSWIILTMRLIRWSMRALLSRELRSFQVIRRHYNSIWMTLTPEVVGSLITDTISEFDPDQQETVVRPY